MRRIMIAFRVFFATLFRAEVAREVDRVLRGAPPRDQAVSDPPSKPDAKSKKPASKKPAPKKPPVRSDAVTLLATLQREARFVDFIQEPLGDYSDAQIGAAARDVHRDCGLVLKRLFGLQPIVSDEEGAKIEVPAGFDAGRYQLSGKVVGEPPFQGRLRHHGWEATQQELPSWSGSELAARTVAPVEVELADLESAE
jgi:hypothetical protein